MIITYAGEKYYKVATDILKIYNDFEIEISDINNLKKGRITIGSTTYLLTYVLPVVLPLFKKQCPNIEVYIVEKNSAELDNALSLGEIDFAIMHTTPFQTITNNIKFDFYVLSKDPFLLVVKKDHPFSQYAKVVNGLEYPKIDINLFKNEPFIMLKRGQGIRQISESILQKANINQLLHLLAKVMKLQDDLPVKV